MIELDTRPSADGELVVFHDDTTERWNGQPELIGTLPWSQLAQLDLSGERIPRLREVCDWAHVTGMALNIEIKVPGIELQVAQHIAAAQLKEQVIVSSFYPQALRSLYMIDPQIKLGVLMGVRSLRPRIRAREAWPLWTLRHLHASSWHPAVQLPFLPRIIHAVQRRGYTVNVWTVDDPVLLRQLIAVGVDGIITNRPSVLHDIIESERIVPQRPARWRRPR